jgi:hypothetical protein
MDPEFPLLVEHCSTEDLPRISAYLQGRCAELGIRVIE